MMENISEKFEIIDAKIRALNNIPRSLPKTKPINLMNYPRYVKKITKHQAATCNCSVCLLLINFLDLHLLLLS